MPRSLTRLIAVVYCVAVLSSSAHAAAGVGAGGPGPIPTGGTPVTPWALMVCPALIVVAAFVNHHRELTAAEAWSCGLLALFPPVRVYEPPLRVKG
jgi:hypothetical protein